MERNIQVKQMGNGIGRERKTPIHKGQVDGSSDIGGGENEDVGMSLDLVQLSQ